MAEGPWRERGRASASDYTQKEMTEVILGCCLGQPWSCLQPALHVLGLPSLQMDLPPWALGSIGLEKLRWVSCGLFDQSWNVVSLRAAGPGVSVETGRDNETLSVLW